MKEVLTVGPVNHPYRTWLFSLIANKLAKPCIDVVTFSNSVSVSLPEKIRLSGIMYKPLRGDAISTERETNCTHLTLPTYNGTNILDEFLRIVFKHTPKRENSTKEVRRLSKPSPSMLSET